MLALTLTLLILLGHGALYLFLRWQVAELKAELLRQSPSKAVTSGAPTFTPSPFVPDEEAWPKDVREALASYPPELAEPTRTWIREQRRHRVDWGVIKRKVLSNPDNANMNNWGPGASSDEAGARETRHVVGHRPRSPGIQL